MTVSWLLLSGSCRCTSTHEADATQEASRHQGAWAQATREGAPLRVHAEGWPDLKLAVVRAVVTPLGVGGELRLIAVGERAGWVYGVDLGLRFNRLEPGVAAPALESARCGVRYWNRGTLNEAGMGIGEARIEILKEQGGRRAMNLKLRCDKRVFTTGSGSPHAPELPASVQLSGVVWTEIKGG